MNPWTHASLHPKWHLDRFSRFAGFTVVTSRHSVRQTTLRRDICSSSPHLLYDDRGALIIFFRSKTDLPLTTLLISLRIIANEVAYVGCVCVAFQVIADSLTTAHKSTGQTVGTGYWELNVLTRRVVCFFAADSSDFFVAPISVKFDKDE